VTAKEEQTMLKTMRDIRGYSIAAINGELGKVDDAYFDDERWTIRYLVADVGHWLRGRKVLISPHAIARIDSNTETVDMPLTKSQIENSPPIDTNRPISRRMEDEFNRYYRYSPYWAGGYTTGLWGFGALPLAGLDPVPHSTQKGPEREEPPSLAEIEEIHLRSAREVTGYHVAATDGGIGHVEDFVFDEGSWAIRYLVVDTRDWWPGRHVLVSPEHVNRTSWPERAVHLDVARIEVERSPEYDSRRPPESSIALRT
jgi:uncharacterized protein YrrD